MSDPLSFFAANSDSDDTDSSNEDGNVSETEKSTVKRVEKTENKILPPPIDVLSDPKKLEFVVDDTQRSVDWDKLTRKAPAVVSTGIQFFKQV